MVLSRLISQLRPFDFISFLFHLLALAMDYLTLKVSSALNPRFKRGAFEDLPPEIAIDILSRLPIRSIVNCKRVSKPWRDLIESREFINFHRSNSAAALVSLAEGGSSMQCKLSESDLDGHGFSYNPVIEFDLPFRGCVMLCGSANGLICLGDPSGMRSDLYLCNPVTREYVKLDSPCHDYSFYDYDPCVVFGFGASKIGEHKVVRITHDRSYEPLPAVGKCECQVYTLGTGSWRSIEAEGAQLYFNDRIPGVFVNGNLHWFAWNSLGSPLVSCFDLETETFSPFSLPSHVDHVGRNMNLFASRNCLGLCDCNTEIVIWLMKEYGTESSWAKEFVISINLDSYLYDHGLLGELYDDEVYADDPYADELYVEEPYFDEIYDDEPHADEFYADEPHADEFYADEPYGDDHYAAEPYFDELYDEEVLAADPYADELYADELYADDHYADTVEPYFDEPYADELNADELHADDPYAAELYAEEPYAGDPHDHEFYANKVYGDELYGDEPYADIPYYAVYPIKIFEDGDILIAWLDTIVFLYSSKTKTIERLPTLKQHSPGDCISPILHTPSFVSLKSLCCEGCNVRSF
ncbi:unnamed protein product [Cuscuta campestris]|uniref:F-box domain-containing protein n=1 Tax=Cuscuta campestris TaxID=132261 RepID=A0A484MFF8_9ASTE|nr:unnamed protein product [Cuscuta campestris]